MKFMIRTLLFLLLIIGTACGQTQSPELISNEHQTIIHNPERFEDKKLAGPIKGMQSQQNAQYEVTDHWYITPIDEQTNEEVVLLTIDDAPDGYALDMAKTLKDLDAPAIFFVNGHFLETVEEKNILKEIYDMGFIIGNHTYSHDNLQSLTEEEQESEIIRVNDMVEEIIGERPQFFRAPFGQYTEFSKQLAKEEGMVLMNWVYGYDWDKKYMTKESITDIMINTNLLSNGANLLMHDREWTAAGLADIVIGLRAKGYEMIDPHLIQTLEN